MGNSSPPFLYGKPTSYSFSGPTDPKFNPKAVTQASWTRPKPKPKVKGPLINFNRHPDSYSNIPNGRSLWKPMSPWTKAKVIYGRRVQLGFRVLALIGALGSLFCAIVIKNVATTIIWIVRAGPGVAILHTLYAIYHLFRSPVTRPPASQASYMVFAATLDLGLVPFYAFTAYLGYKEWTSDAYNWGTLINSDADTVTIIAKSTFLVSVVNGGLHLVSLGISIFLFSIFRKISQLPPDLNPLEDTLTTRAHKRSKSEIAEKHASSSTIDSSVPSIAEPLIGAPRTVPFMHTRAQSSDDSTMRFSIDIAKEPRPLRSSIPQMPFYLQPDPIEDVTYEMPEHDPGVVTRPTSSLPRTPVREPSPEVPNRSQCVSPASENWIAYPSRSTTPGGDTQKEPSPARETSSNYSRTVTPGSGVIDWMGIAQKYGWDVGETISEDVRGEYESLTLHETYGNDADAHNFRKNGLYDHDELDIGDNQIAIYQDHSDAEDGPSSEFLRVNPLGLNPPTPQPVINAVDTPRRSSGRVVLTDIPNLSPTPAGRVPPLDSPAKNDRFYGELEGMPGLSVSRKVSNVSEGQQPMVGRKKSKLVKRKSHKLSTYGALKQQDDHELDKDIEDDQLAPTDPEEADRDRKGRVVSNSGADFAPGSSSRSYGNYIAGLGVGRRRDVSGKVAEEGRGGLPQAATTPTPTTPKDSSLSIPRAAGWARFAGL